MVYKYHSYLHLLDMSRILLLPDSYSEKCLNTERVFPLIDARLQDLITNVNNQEISNFDHNFLDRSMTVMNIREAITRNLFANFKQQFQNAIETNPVNNITHLDLAARKDICCGCTQYIDTLYMRYGPNNIQVLEHEYIYHERLNPDIVYRTLQTIEPNTPLIISQPFYYGTSHIQMADILDHCLAVNVPVHIDGAWITACKNIDIDFNHPAIVSLGISMSKGYGLSGWNRIGLRWTKETTEDAITIMNDYVQIPAENVAVGLYFLKQIEPNYLWNTHGLRYNKICNDFGLTPTDSIHLATNGSTMIGVEALIRYLEANDV